MHAPPVRRFAALAVAIPLVVGVAGCSDGSEGDKGNATKACPSNITNTVSTQLPSDLPAPTGASAPYNYSNQGKTQVWFFAVDGSPDQLPSMRDAYNSQLQSKGYKLGDTDQEKDAEAEGEFSGPHDGTTNFRPLCTGKVDVRIKITS
jgi:hypothetical protein